MWPRVGRRTRKGGFWSGRVPARHAWAYPYLETTDAGATWATLTYDCDNRQAMASGLSELPPWNWFVETTRGAHVTWALAVPVAKHAAARAAPETYLSHVAEYYHAALGADPAFNGLGRNPAHPDAKVLWGAPRPYTLGELSSVVPFNWRKPRIAQTGIGRNRDMFMSGLRGASANRDVAALTILHTINAEIAAMWGKPLMPDRELGYMARSIERYRAKWERHGHAPRWIARQAARSAMQLGKARKASASNEGSNEQLRPWEAEGISRRTWYRRRRAARERGTVPNTDIARLEGHP